MARRSTLRFAQARGPVKPQRRSADGHPRSGIVRFACKALDADRDRLAFWLAAGCGLVLADGAWRLEGVAGNPRQPSPAPVPETLARAAIDGGAPSRRDGDLFARAA